ncbi:hypothetical protein ABK040_010986 [Willaertia magna]
MSSNNGNPYAAKQLNERINSLKNLMNQFSQNQSHSPPNNNTNTVNGPMYSFTSPTIARKSVSPVKKSMYGSKHLQDSLDQQPTMEYKTPINTHQSNGWMTGSMTTPIMDLPVDDDEVKVLRENNQRLSIKITQLQDNIHNYAVKLQYSNEQTRELEQKLRVSRNELDMEIEKRRSTEREYQDEIRNIQHNLEEVQAQLELSEHKEKIASESREALENINRDLDKSNKEKTQHIIDLSRELSQKKTELEASLNQIYELRAKMKQYDLDLEEEKIRWSKAADQHKNEVRDIKEKYEDRIKKLTKHIEKEKNRTEQMLEHFKGQVTILEDQAINFKKQMGELQQTNNLLQVQLQNAAQREKFYKTKVDSVQDSVGEQKTQFALMQQTYVHTLKEKEDLALSEKKLKEEMNDVEKKHELKVEKLNNEITRLEKSIQQQQQKIHQLTIHNTTLEKKINQLENENFILRTESQKELGIKQEEINKWTRLHESNEKEKQTKIDRLQRDLNEKQEYIEKLKAEFTNQSQHYQQQLEMIRDEINDKVTDNSEAIEKQDLFLKQLGYMNERVKLLEGENELLHRRIQQYEAGSNNERSDFIDKYHDNLKEALRLQREQLLQLKEKEQDLLKEQEEKEHSLLFEDDLEEAKNEVNEIKETNTSVDEGYAFKDEELISDEDENDSNEEEDEEDETEKLEELIQPRKFHNVIVRNDDYFSPTLSTLRRTVDLSDNDNSFTNSVENDQ